MGQISVDGTQSGECIIVTQTCMYNLLSLEALRLIKIFSEAPGWLSRLRLHLLVSAQVLISGLWDLPPPQWGSAQACARSLSQMGK